MDWIEFNKPCKGLSGYKKLLWAVTTAHKLKDEKLNIVDHNSFYSWNQLSDNGWLKYGACRNLIRSYPRIEKFLCRFDWI